MSTRNALNDIKTKKKAVNRHFRDGKKELVATKKMGESMDTCATIHKEYICCNVKVLKSISNCPFDCSYCFLQDYLNTGALSYVSDTKTLIKEVTEKCAAQPWRLFRIGTWELGDSLALEDKIGQAQELIAAFATIPNALLELKTKSDNVDPILKCDHKQKTVVSFSLNPAYIVDKEEHKTAPLHKRLLAIKKAQEAGYLIGLHIDPMIAYPDWEAGYGELVDAIFKHVSPNQVAWISMGSLRFNPEQKRLMHINFPGSKIASNEMVLGSDRKLRYVKPFRLMMYKYLYQKLCEKGAKEACVYLCMERFNVWESVFGYSPTSIGHLDYLFADSLGKRFKHLSNIKPDLILYERFQDT